MYKPPFLFSGGTRVNAPPVHCHARRCRYKERLFLIVEAQIHNKCRVWHVICHQRPDRISLLLFQVLQRLPKSFSGTWYMTSPRSVFVMFSLSFRCKLRPHFHLGFYALQSRQILWTFGFYCVHFFPFTFSLFVFLFIPLCRMEGLKVSGFVSTKD